MTSQSKRAIFALTLAVASTGFLGGNHVSGASVYTGPTNGNYSDGANWTPGGDPNGSLFDVVIGDPIDANVNVNLDQVITVNTLTVDDGSSLSIAGGNGFSGGTLTTVGSGVIKVTAGQSAGITGNITLTSGSKFIISDNATLNVAGGVTIIDNGTISFASGGNQVRFQMVGGGTVTLGGNGTMSLSDNQTNNLITAAAAGMVLDNTANHTISGLGEFTQDPGGTTRFDITNEGKIIALGGTLRVNALGNLTNTGSLIAGDGTNGATLSLENVAINNVGGTVTALNAGVVSFNNGSSIVGGTFSTSGTGVIQVGNGQSTSVSGNITLTSGSVLHVNDNSTLNVAGGSVLTNLGVISLISAGNQTRFQMVGGGTVTLGGNGTLSLSTNQSNNMITATVVGMVLDNTANSTISGVGEFTQDPGGTHNFDITNEGKIIALGGTLRINTLGNLTNTGSLTAGDGTNAATLSLENVNIDNVAGGIFATNGSVVNFNNGLVIKGGTLTSSGTGSLVEVVSQTLQLLGNVTLTTGSVFNIRDNATVVMAGGNTLTNNGVISLLSGGNQTRFEMNGTGTLTLAGNGTLSLATNQTNNIIVAIASDMTLNNTVSHTISGTGEFTQDPGGTDPYNILNEGTITALVGSLQFNQFGNVTNTGTIRAGDGTTPGTLNLQNDIFINAGGLIEATVDSIVNLRNGLTINGGTLTSVGTGLFSENNGQAVQLTGNVILTAGSTLKINDSAVLNVAGGFTLTNNGIISLLSGGNQTRFQMTGGGTVTLGGNGTLSFGTNQLNNIITAASSGMTLDITAGQTISGTGTFTDAPGGTSAYNITNEGKIIALGGTIAFNAGGNLTNSNLIAAGDGVTVGTLNLQAITIQNTGGTIEANDGSTIHFQNGLTIVGGSLTTAGTGVIVQDNSTSSQIPGSLTLTTGTVLHINDSAILNVAGGSVLTNNGIISLLSGGNLTRFQMTGGGTVTLGGNGTLSFGTNQPNNVITAASANMTLDIMAGQTISGTGSFTNAPGGTAAYDITNEGRIIALNGAIAFNAGGNLTNSGLIAAGDGTTAGTLNLQSITIKNTGGTIESNDGSTIHFQNGLTIVGGNLTTAGTGVIVQDSATSSQLTGNTTLTSGSVLRINDSANLNVAGGFTYTNNGIISVQSGGNQARFQLNGNGTVVLAGNGTLALGTFAANLIDAVSSGMTLDNTLGHTISGGGTFSDQPLGTLVFTVTNEGLIAASGATMAFDQNGNVTNTGTISAGTATSTGTLNLIHVTINNAGGLLTAANGSTVSLFNGDTINGGTLSTAGSGIFQVPSGNTSVLTGNTTLATGTQLIVHDSATLQVTAGFTYTNNGTISIQSGGNQARFQLVGTGTVSLAGSGSLVLSGIPSDLIVAASGGMTLDNQFPHTISGGGQFTDFPVGTQVFSLTNEGTVHANLAGQTLLIATDIPASNTGTFEASNGGTLNDAGVLDQDTTGDLTAGTYFVNAGSLVFLSNSPSITTNDATIILNGAGSNFETKTSTLIETTLATNNGTLEVLGGRNYSTTLSFVNAGKLQLGGGTFVASNLTNNSDATIIGFGNLTNRPLNHGTIESSGGTLVLADGINGGSGTIQSDLGSTLDLSGGSSGSNGDFLINNGNLMIGANNVTVAQSYTNANFGVGDAFNKHANVSTSGGKILASGNNTEVLSTTTIDFANVHVGDTNSQSFTITNAGTSGPSVLFAVQPHANGGNLDDLGLSVTSQNVGPLGLGATSSPLNVTYFASHGGPLVGQVVHVDNNFDNITPGNISILGTAYFLASPLVTNASVSFPNHHVGDTVTSLVGVLNNGPLGNYTEKLDAVLSNATGNATFASNLSLIPAGSSGNITATLNTNNVGHISGTANVTLISDGNGTSGLANTTVSTVLLSATGDVYRLANAGLAAPNPVVFANHHEHDVVAPIAITISNTAANDGFSEKLDASLSNVSDTGVVISGNISLLSPGQAASTLLATLDTSTAGHKSGSATAAFTSDGEAAGTLDNSGLGTTPLSNSTNQALAGSGDVYRLASAGTSDQRVFNLGPVHVGAFTFVNPTFTNTSTNDGFSESLAVQITGHTANAGVTGGSANSVVFPASSRNNFVSVFLDTTNAQIGASGSQTFHFESDGNGTLGGVNDGLGLTDNIAPDQTVTINADILNYAVASIVAGSGGTLTSTDSTHFTLDLGTIAPGNTASGGFEVANSATGPADTLSGSFTSDPSNFSFASLSPFAGLVAGGAHDVVGVTFSSNTLGVQTETITLFGSSDDSASSTSRNPIFITLTADVESSTVPEPASLALLGFGAAAMLTRRRRSSR